jgi:ATP synthase protein I
MRNRRHGRTQARKVIWTQLAVTALASLGFWIFSGPAAGVAALAGGMINVVANLFFVRRWFAADGVESPTVVSPTQRVLGFYVAEVVKLFITVALLALAIGVLKLSFMPLFVTFVATLMVFWLALSPQFWKLVGGRS